MLKKNSAFELSRRFVFITTPYRVCWFSSPDPARWAFQGWTLRAGFVTVVTVSRSGITIPLQIVRLNHLSDTECCQRSVDFFELLNSPTSDS